MDEMFSRFYYWFCVQKAQLKVSGYIVSIRGLNGKYSISDKYNGPCVFDTWLLPRVVRRDNE